MLKLYITVRETDGDKAVDLFEDYQLAYEDKHAMLQDEELTRKIMDKINEVEIINNQITSPF